MKAKILLAICFFQLSFNWPGVIQVHVIKRQSDYFTSDNLGNVYLVKGDEIAKYNQKGELLKLFSNKKSGRVSTVDATNVLRILVFYKDLAQITFLDSQLSQNGDNIYLEQMGLEQCDLACTSFNNGLWLFNRQNAELLRLDEHLNKVVSTGNLNRLLNTVLQPVMMLENNGFLYLNNPQQGILVFDIYGTYYKTIAIKDIKAFQVRDQILYYLKEDNFRAYETKLLHDTVLLKVPLGVKELQIQGAKYYLRFRDSLLIQP